MLAEGTLGHLTQAALDYYDLHGTLPVRWELGVKEVWKVEKPLDKVIHTMGWPLRKRAKYNEFGGSFIYPMGEDKLCIGMVIGLDYTDSTLSCHDLLQELKTHPFVAKMLEGGERVAWGAKTIPSGGYFSMPRSLAVPGMAIAGDAASMVNVPTLKGVHYAIQAGMYAAEAIFEALKKDSVNLDAYDEKVRKSEIERDLFESRNMRAAVLEGLLRRRRARQRDDRHQGHVPGRQVGVRARHRDPDARRGRRASSYPKPDNKLTFNKLDSVFLSGNATRDDAPNHVKIQSHVPRRAREDLGQPLPGAGLRDPRRPARERRGRGRRPRHRLELRPVRRDQRQGRAADDARGRRRAALPRGLTATPTSRLRLRDGSEVVVRPIRARRQGGAIAAAFERLSEQSRYQRFMTAIDELSPSQLDYLTEVDHHDHEALHRLRPGELATASGSRGSSASRTARPPRRR